MSEDKKLTKEINDIKQRLEKVLRKDDIEKGDYTELYCKFGRKIYTITIEINE